MEKKYVIEFRVVGPYDYMTPLYHIPKESTRVSGNNVFEAQRKFFKMFENCQYVTILDTYEWMG